jgi:hypothetical protein
MRNSATKRPRNTTLAPCLRNRSQQQGVTVSQPEPVAGVVANDRAEGGCRNHHANVEAGFCRGINGSEYEDRFARQGQSHTFQPHDERHLGN